MIVRISHFALDHTLISVMQKFIDVISFAHLHRFAEQFIAQKKERKIER